jgi:hypothetical protein
LGHPAQFHQFSTNSANTTTQFAMPNQNMQFNDVFNNLINVIAKPSFVENVGDSSDPANILHQG